MRLCRPTNKDSSYGADQDLLCTWLNAENGIVSNGDGRVVLCDYAYVHQVYGQLAPVERTLKPQGNGYTKRRHVVFQLVKTVREPDQNVESSREYLKAL